MKTITILGLLLISSSAYALPSCPEKTDAISRGIFDCQESDKLAVFYDWSYAPPEIFGSRAGALALCVFNRAA